MRTFGTRLVESSWNRRWRHIGTEVEFRIGFKHRSLVRPLEYGLGSGKRAKWFQGLGLSSPRLLDWYSAPAHDVRFSESGPRFWTMTT